ncbi:MAG TPA: hypothetical protein VJ990_07830 [Clostridia bacterium]|nr:hypothetical protein [Clostridia bacterium]
MAQRYKNKRSKRSRKNRSGRIILSILFLCVISALVGFYGVKFMLSGNEKPISAEAELASGEETAASGAHEEQGMEISDLLEKTTGENQEDEIEEPVETVIEDGNKQVGMKTEQINLKLYAYQLGGFSTRENAENFLGELNESGEFGTIVEENNFKVLNVVYADVALNEYFKNAAKDIADDAFLYRIEKTIEVSYEADKEKEALSCVEDYESAISIIGDVQSDYVGYLNSNLTRENFVETVSVNLAAVESLKLRLEDLDSGGVFFDGLGAWYESLEKVLKKVAETENKDCMDDLSELYLNGI